MQQGFIHDKATLVQAMIWWSGNKSLLDPMWTDQNAWLLLVSQGPSESICLLRNVTDQWANYLNRITERVNFIIKSDTTEMGFDFNHVDMWFNL